METPHDSMDYGTHLLVDYEWHSHSVLTDEHGMISYAHGHPNDGSHDHDRDDHLAHLGSPGEVKGPDPAVWGTDEERGT